MRRNEYESFFHRSARDSLELREVIDPELGVNIVDLGLAYNILFDDDRVIIEFTATTPGCPMRRF